MTAAFGSRPQATALGPGAWEHADTVVVQVVGDCFGHGIDDTHIKIRGAPVLDEPALESHQKMIADKLTVSELMTMAVVALPPVVKVRTARTLKFDRSFHFVIGWDM